MSRKKTAATLTVVATLAGAGTALAAHPRAGKIYAGPTSARAFNGFKPVASFTVSKNGKQLLRFLYQSSGCFGSGGAGKPGVDYFLKPWNTHQLGTIADKANGTFSLKNHKTTYTVQNQETVTTSTVSGHFKNRNTAVGEITFSQKFSQPGSPGSQCGPATVRFTATLRP
jgi:hypothetical protein